MNIRQSLIAPLLILAIGHATVVRADLYWDSNGADPGGSDTTKAPGTWGSDNFWGASDGLGATGPWVADETAVFAADSNVFGTYNVAVNGPQSASGVRFEDGAVTLTGGTVNLTNAATVTVNAGLTGTISSVIGGTLGLKVASGGGSTLVLNGANNYTGATAFANSAGGANVLQLGANEVIPNTSIVQFNGQNGILDLNGKTETVKSITNVGGGPFTGSKIEIGTGTLIIEDTGETQTYALTYTGSSTGKIIKNGSGTLNLTGSSLLYDGEFVLNAGTVGMGEIRVFGDNTSSTAKLTINGGTLTSAATRSMRVPKVDIGGDFTFSAISPVQVEFIGASVGTPVEGSTVVTLKATPTINVPTANTFLIFRGPVVDDGGERGIIKTGAGVLTINNPGNTYGGDTTIQGGQIRIDDTSDLGDGTGTLHLSGGSLNTTQSRDLVSEPVPNPIDVTADSAITTTQAGNVTLTPSVDLNFTSNNIGGSNGTLTFRNDAAVTVANPSNTFDPRFTGSGFNFSRPIVLAAGGVVPATRFTRLNSANSTGTQTFSGEISGPGKFRRMTTGGTTVLTAANSFTGGLEVEGGTLSISGGTATAGAGNIAVTGGTLSIASGVANAIANTAALTISGTGIVNLGAGIDELIAALTLGADIKGPGTYGSSDSPATNKLNQYFSGTGMVRIAAAHIAGDYNGDNKVDNADLTVWAGQFGTLAAGQSADDDLDGDVDGKDFLTWQANYGAPGDGAATVPEPATLGLVVLSVALALGVRKRELRRR